MFLPLISRYVDPVRFNISPLYQIISSHHFHQLSYYIPHFKRELFKHHVRDPESSDQAQTKASPELHIERIDLQLLSNKLLDIVLSGNANKNNKCVLILSYHVTLLA